jgi:predicted Zn-ribbon and HTH transcriptional regulator
MLLLDGFMSHQESKNEFPSFGEQGKNLTELVRKMMDDVAKGENLFVDDFEQQRRYDMCQVCEHFVSGPKRCKKCGCFMKNKVVFKASQCPVGKW